MSHASFLDDILANPTDDAARLVYAEWLEEQSNPRGEFIRLQIERAQQPIGSPDAIASLQRERQLLRKHGKAWAGSIAKDLQQLPLLARIRGINRPGA